MADEKKTITIKSTLSDKAFIDAIAKKDSCTMAEAFAKVIALAKNAENSEKNIDEIEALKNQIAEKQIQLDEVATRLADVTQELQKIENQPPQTIEIEKIIEKTIEKQLTGHQFICELDEPTALAARKIRKFALQDGIVNTTDGFEYANQLANYSIKKILQLKYENLL